MKDEKLLKHLPFVLESVRWGTDLSQKEVSEKTGIQQSKLSAYENGKLSPSLKTIILLADVYDVSIDYLVGRCRNRQAHKTKSEIKYKEND